MIILIALVLFTFLSLLMAPRHAWDNITFADRNALVFEHRHQAYGAYRLRRRYDRHLAAGLLAAFGLMALVALGSKWLAPDVASLSPPKGDLEIAKKLDRIFVLPPAPPPGPSDKHRAKAPVVKVRNTGDKAVITVVEGADVKPLTPPPLVDTTMSGSGEREGGPDGFGMVDAGGADGGEGDANGVAGGFGPKVFDGFEVQELPEFPGGEPGLAQWVNRNLDYFPDRPGREMIFVQFTIMPDGSVADVMAVKGGNKAHRAATERALRRMPRWKPARMNGHEVPCRLTLPIRFETR